MSKQAADSAEKQSPLERVSAFIVDKRKAFYLIYIGFAIFCVFSSGWVAVNDDLTSYLPDTTETRQGLTIMDEEFVTFGTSRIMVDNITYALAEQVRAIQGVKSVEFDGTEDHYHDGAALFSITYGSTAASPVSADALEEVKALLDEAYRVCQAILLRDRAKLEEVARYLLEHEVMDGKTFESIMKEQG